MNYKLAKLKSGPIFKFWGAVFVIVSPLVIAPVIAQAQLFNSEKSRSYAGDSVLQAEIVEGPTSTPPPPPEGEPTEPNLEPAPEDPPAEGENTDGGSGLLGQKSSSAAGSSLVETTGANTDMSRSYMGAKDSMSDLYSVKENQVSCFVSDLWSEGKTLYARCIPAYMPQYQCDGKPAQVGAENVPSVQMCTTTTTLTLLGSTIGRNSSTYPCPWDLKNPPPVAEMHRLSAEAEADPEAWKRKHCGWVRLPMNPGNNETSSHPIDFVYDETIFNVTTLNGALMSHRFRDSRMTGWGHHNSMPVLLNYAKTSSGFYKITGLQISENPVAAGAAVAIPSVSSGSNSVPVDPVQKATKNW